MGGLLGYAALLRERGYCVFASLGIALVRVK